MPSLVTPTEPQLHALVARDDALATVDAFLTTTTPNCILFLHGPVGVGKSALLDAAAERAERRGLRVLRASAGQRDLDVGLEPCVPDLGDDVPALLLIDDVHQVDARTVAAREERLARLPASTKVIVASRRPPTAEWLGSPWWTVAEELGLRPLDDVDAAKLLSRLAVPPEDVPAVVAWAAGLPLALHAAARHLDGPTSPLRIRPLHEAWCVVAPETLLGDDGDDPAGLLGLAATVRVVTRDLVQAALPAVDADTAMRWLATRSYITPIGDGYALQEPVRAVLRARRGGLSSAEARAIRRRAADHFHARAIAGATRCAADLGELVEDPLLRSGFGGTGGSRFRVDGMTGADEQTIARALWARGLGRWWPHTASLLVHARDWVTVVRDPADTAIGYAIAATPLRPPPGHADDPILGPWLEHARAAGALDAIVWRDAFSLQGEDARPVRSVLNTAVVLRSGVPNPRYAYLPVLDGDAGSAAFAARAGGVHLPALDVRFAGTHVRCFVIDYGPGGLLGAQRDAVYCELGLPLPQTPCASAEVVREALRAFADAERLARSPLAQGATVEQRAASARMLLERARATAFGTSDRQRQLAAIVDRAYFKRTDGHEGTAHGLGLPRQTYFRLLRQAVGAMADALANPPAQLLEELLHRERPGRAA